MLYKDYTTKLLDMEHMNIRKIEVTESEILLHVDMKRRLVSCPVCENMTDSVHDYRIQKVKDSPVQGKALVWIYRKRRYVLSQLRETVLRKELAASQVAQTDEPSCSAGDRKTVG